MMNLEVDNMKNKKFLPILLSILMLFSHALLVYDVVQGVSTSNESVTPSTFSPDGNGLNDTVSITFQSTAGQTLYLNIFYNSSELVRSDISVNEVSSGNYSATWNGKDDNNTYVTEEDEAYTIRVTDVLGGGGGNTIGTVNVDLTAPTISTFSIAGGAQYTTDEDGEVTLTISASGATKMKVSNYANFSGATWETYSTSKSWTLLNPSSDGTKTVYINFRDDAGTNTSTSDSIELDTTLATPTLSINSGSSATNDTDVTLTITANGASQMKIDNDTNFLNMSSWMDKTSTYNFTLPSGSGSKTVYLQVRDEAGNTKTTSDSITLDTTAPSNITLSIDEGSYTNTRNVNLTISAEGGPSMMYLSNDGSSWTGYSYATSKSWQLSAGEGSKTVYLRVADAAGNNGSKTASITVDMTNPSNVNLVSPSDGATVTTQTPSFSWTNPNTNASTKWFFVEILQSGSVEQSSYTNKSTLSYTATTLAQGSYTWRVTVYDMANNSATTSQRSFTIAVDGLAIPGPTYPANAARVNNSAPNMPRIRWSQVDGQGTITYRYKIANSSTNLSSASYSSTTSLYADLDLSSYSTGDRVYWQVLAKNTTDESNYSTARYFILDNVSPTLSSPSIAGGETYTSTRSVTITLSATGASWMKVSENSSFNGTTWEAYSTSKSFTLSSGDGTKTVYFIAKDNAVGDQGSTAYANVNNTATSDTIILDTTGPTIDDQIPSSTTTSSTPEISAALSDGGSGVDKTTLIITVDGENQTQNATITSSEVMYTPSSALSDGSYTVNISVSDNVSNVGYLEWTFTVSTDDDDDDDDDDDSGGSSPGGGLPPAAATPSISISDISQTPETVTSEDSVEVSATITATNEVHRASIYYEVNGDLESKVMSASDSSYSATIGPFSEGTTVTYYIHVVDGNAETQDSSNYSFTVDDTSGPSISLSSPTSGSRITDTKPVIIITYSDPSGIDTDTIEFTLDSVDKTSSATSTSAELTYTPTTELSYGQHSITFSVSDYTGNANEETWTFTIIADESEIIEIIDEIDKGETQEIDMSDYGSAISGISITAASSLTDIEITCKTHNSKPSTVTTPDNTVYLYLDIEANVDDDDIDSLTITFKVAKDWFTTNNIDKNKVKLLRYHNNAWQELSTTMTSEDSSFVYFEATTPGLSTFAITGEPVGETPGFPDGIPWLFVIVGLIGAIVVAVLLLIKTGYISVEREN
jgi:PGF-pre-PGF domain-containing protein